MDRSDHQAMAGNTAMYVFPLAVLLAFLALAAQYNSWSLPFAVLLIAPMALLSAIVGVWLSGGTTTSSRKSFVVLVGLAAKNAILIVEFARSKEDDGVDPLAAVLEAARLRLRPILMTSLAFIAGVVPLVLGSGAGAEMRHAMGVAVFAGMLGVTLFGLVLTPVFYVVVRKLVLRKEKRKGQQAAIETHASLENTMKTSIEVPGALKKLSLIALAVALAGCSRRPGTNVPRRRSLPAIPRDQPTNRPRQPTPIRCSRQISAGATSS